MVEIESQFHKERIRRKSFTNELKPNGNGYEQFRIHTDLVNPLEVRSRFERKLRVVTSHTSVLHNKMAHLWHRTAVHRHSAS